MTKKNKNFLFIQAMCGYRTAPNMYKSRSKCHTLRTAAIWQGRKRAFILCTSVATFFPFVLCCRMPAHTAIYHKRQQIQSSRQKWIDNTWKIFLAICWNCIMFLWANSMDASESIIKKAASHLGCLSWCLAHFGATSTLANMNLKSPFLLLAFLCFCVSALVLV